MTEPVVAVRSCGDCPFRRRHLREHHRWVYDESSCSLSGRRVDHFGEPAPDGCPLRSSAVRVELAR